MRSFLLVPALTAVWSLAPFFGSPASLWVMPTVAGLAAWWTTTVRGAVTASTTSLLVMVLAWSLMVLAAGGASASALSIVAFHAPVVAVLAAGAGCVATRVRGGRAAKLT